MEASIPQPHPAEDLSISRRVLGWLDSHADRIGNVIWPRNTPVGLSAHMTDDPNTVGDTSVEAIVGHLQSLVEHGLVERATDGTYSRTAHGNAALGGVVYADEVAAGRLVAMPDGTHVAPDAVPAPASAPVEAPAPAESPAEPTA